MARTVTVQEICDEVKILAEDPNHKLATETEYVRRVNRTNARLYAMYVKAEPDRYRTEVTVTGTGASAYNLPADWLSTIGVDFVNGNERDELERLQEEERNDFVGMSGTCRKFRMLGTQLIFYPALATGYTATHIYIPTAPVIASVGDTIDCRNGHELWIEFCVARDLLKSKNEYDGRWDADIEKVEIDLREEANWRYFTDMVTMAQKRVRRRWPYGPGPNDRWPWLMWP